MFIFTAQRYIYDLIIVIFFVRQLFFLACLSLIIGIPIAYTMNKIMIIFLGPFFSSVFDTGLRFNLPLFMFATILTVAAHYLPRYMAKRNAVDQALKQVRKKEKLKESFVADDNHRNYEEFF